MKNVTIADVPKPQAKIFKDFHAETKADDSAGKRILVAKISTPNTDRSKDHVLAKGAVTANFMKNPVVQFAHKYDELPIAKCIALKIADDGILATVEFPEEGQYQKSDVIYWMYKNGYLNAWSIGFMPLEDGYEANKDGGYDFTKWELFEFSSVPVPDNPEALTVLRSKGINVDLVLEKKDAPAKEEENEVEPAEEAKAVETEEIKEEVVAKDADNPADPGYTDDTKITALTVAQMKNLIDEVLDAEELEEAQETIEDEQGDKSAATTVIKDISQVTSLAYILSELQWIAYCFESDEVSQGTQDKLNQAIALILEAIKDQAELGKKSFAIADKDLTTLDEAQRAKLVAWSIEKAGRTISAKHEEMLKGACDHMGKAAEQVQTVLDTVAAQNDDAGEKGKQPTEEKGAPEEDFLTKMANQLKTSTQQQAAILRNQKEQKAATDTTLSYLQQISSEIGGE